MKRLLLFIATLLLSSAVTITTTACNNGTILKKDLKNDLIKTDLKTVPQETVQPIPTDHDLKRQLLILNDKIQINNIRIIDKSQNSAFVVGDGIIYNKDTIKITYNIQVIDIRTIIVDGASIGNFSTNGQKPTMKVVYSRVKEKYPQLEMDCLKIDVISNQEAIIAGDRGSRFYTGKVTVTFTINDSIDLSSIINKKDLTVKTNGHHIPSKDDVIQALHNTYQGKLDPSFIAIEINATNSSAIIASTNKTKYTGKVLVNLNVDMRADLKDIINKGLNKIAITGKSITLEDVKNELQIQYPTLKMNAIAIRLENNSVTIKSINQYVYTGDDVVINNLVIDLSSVLSNTLPIFNIPGQNHPNKDQLISALKAANCNLDLNKIIITNITDNSAVICGDNKFYSNDVINVTYNCDKAEFLSDVFINLSLGTIKTNGLSKPNLEEIKNAIRETNPNIKLNGINISDDDIFTEKVTISGDGIIYKGNVVASFIVDSSTINNDQLKYAHSETNTVGSTKKDWTSNDITILSNWKKYASDWNSFSNKFQKLTFGNDSYFSVYCNTYTDKKLIGSQLSMSTVDISNDRNIKIFQLDYSYDGGLWGASLELHGCINLWHDEENIYVCINWSFDTSKCFRDRVWAINLQGVTFN